MIRMDLYHRQFQIRKFSEMTTDKHFVTEAMQLPRGSTFHYLPESETVTGPSGADPLFVETERNIYVEHVHKYRGTTEGRMRELPHNADKDVKAFHRRHRLLRRSKNRDTSVRDNKSLLVVNYAPIQHHYLYTRTYRTVYQKWVNLHTTLVTEILEHLRTTDRTQFLRIDVPDKLPTLTTLRKVAKEGWSTDALKMFDTPEAIDVMDAYLMLDPESNLSVYDRIPKEYWSRVNLIWRYQDRWLSISLETLKGFTYEVEGDDKERDVTGVRKRFVSLLMTLQEAGRGGTSPEAVGALLGRQDTDLALDDEDESVPDAVEAKDEEDLDELEAVPTETAEVSTQSIRQDRSPTPEEAMVRIADRLAEDGRLSGAEYRRAKKLAVAYKSVKHPVTKESLDEFATITPDDLAIESEVLVSPSAGVPDDSMRASSINTVRNQYVDKVMHKDITSHLLSLQRMGASITDYSIEKHEDAGGAYEAHAVRIQPLTGSPSTVHFKLPVIDPDGTFTVNGITQYMRWQRGDLPIRKTAPNKVALTSYYGKAFIERSSKVAYDYGSWLTKTLIGIGLDDADTRVKNIKLGNVFSPDAIVPRTYSTLAKKLSRVSLGAVTLYLDRLEVERVFSEDLAKVEVSGWVIVGKKGSDYVVMQNGDAVGAVYAYAEGKPEELGTIEDLASLDVSGAPVDVTEVKLFSKSIALGVALGYMLGFKALYRSLGVTPRVVASGEQLQLQPHEYTIRFSNESYIFSREDTEAALLLNGYNQYKRILQRYSSREFEKKDVYKNILDESGLGVRYARELDLMDSMFVDPITLGILQERNEPETFKGLLYRANELLLTDDHPHENDMGQQRIKGYERMTGAVYQELVRSARGYAMNPNAKKAKFEMNPEAVWYNVLGDASISQSKGNNPISQLRENEDVTFNGVGGRSTRSMVERTRHYHHSDLGVISEATVDSGKVGSTVYLSADPNFTSVRGLTRPRTDEDGPSKHFSTSMLVSPSSDRDDVKRINSL